MTQTLNELELKGRAAKQAAKQLAHVSTALKDQAINLIADQLIERQEEILRANAADRQQSEQSGLGAAMLDRLLLSPARIAGMASDVRVVAKLADPVGEMLDMRTLPNGLQIGRRRVPLGVIAAIYESRPNVTVDIAVLCLKSGNAAILRGGKEAAHSNAALARIIADACTTAGLPAGSVQLIESPDRALVGQLLKMKDTIDLVIPRGGADLISYVRDNATMAVVTGGIGVCHTYVDSTADLEKARDIVHNAKTRRPTICNALDTLLVHRSVAPRFLPMIAQSWGQAGVEMRCDPAAEQILRGDSAGAPTAGAATRAATEADWGKEFLALVAAVKVVDSLDEALDHIARYGSGHSEAIVTEDYAAALRFLDEADAAAVYVNASTQFTDGAQFGLGAEVGISTQKLHARGPMGLRELTTYKWIILGSGQTRPV
ncbi:MAG: glutamate-5-semialdehyde dehydrogenase [Chloroflexota bacterium]|nr:MAG: glutamate-5-semialdehyde dehydrogenase [Chloroflexota bacterium]